MIAYIKGSLEQRAEGYIIVEAASLGYQIFVSETTMRTLPNIGDTVKLHTFMHVKEDGISLYGFATPDELHLFQRLLSVSGVGPKAALGFLTQLTPQELIVAILSEDIKALCKAPGIGKKTAQRVVLELKDKVKTEDALSIDCSVAQQSTESNAAIEAIDALTALGYSRSEAAKAISGIATEDMTTEDILKAALKKMVAF